MTLSAIKWQLWEYSNQGAGAPGLESSDVFLPGMEMVLGMPWTPLAPPALVSTLLFTLHLFSALILLPGPLTSASAF